MAPTDSQGDIARLLRGHGGHQFADRASAYDIKRVLTAWLAALPEETLRAMPVACILAFLCWPRDGHLAAVLNSVLR